MSNLKKQLANDLRILLSNAQDINRISSWADALYWQNIGHNLPELETIAFMDAGPEFVLIEPQLRQIADKWLAEGNYEELGLPIPEIKNSAEDIGKVAIQDPKKGCLI